MVRETLWEEAVGRLFTSEDVALIAGVKLETVRRWESEGPSLKARQGGRRGGRAVSPPGCPSFNP